MNPLRVSGRNFGPYRDFTWEPQDGLTAIVGQNRLGDGVSSNGAGKSTLLDAIRVALFGPELSWSDHLTAGMEDETCVVELEFEHGADRYRVRRTFSAKGRGKSATDLERKRGDETTTFTPDGWAPLTRDRQDDTQKALELLLGLSQSTFAHSVFAAQGAQHFADPALPPRDRKAILADALGLEVWDRLLALVREDMREVEGNLVALDARIGTATTDLEERPVWVAGQRELELRLEGDRAHAAEAAQTAAERRELAAERKTLIERRAAAAHRFSTAQAALAEFARETEDAVNADEEVKSLTEVIAVLEQTAERAPALERKLAGLGTVAESRRAAAAQVAALQAQAADLEREAGARKVEGEQFAKAAERAFEEVRRLESGESSECSHCGQPLKDEALEKALRATHDEGTLLQRQTSDRAKEVVELNTRARALREEAEKVTMPGEVDEGEIAKVTQETVAARAAQAEAQAMRERRAAFAQKIAAAGSAEFRARVAAATEEHIAARDALTATEPVIEDGRDLGREAAEADQEATVATEQVRVTELELARVGEKLRHLDEMSDRLAGALAERGTLATGHERLKVLEKAYGRDGIPALILENSAIPQIETEAQRVLEALGMPFRIELVTQRETKSATVKDTLDVVVHEPNGPRRYETYSGGEQTRLELALRIALARLIAQRRGADVGMLALDEPSWLDRAGHEQLEKVLRGLTEFRSIVLISHDESLVDAFDHHLTVVRDESGSRLEEAA